MLLWIVDVITWVIRGVDSIRPGIHNNAGPIYFVFCLCEYDWIIYFNKKEYGLFVCG